MPYPSWYFIILYHSMFVTIMPQKVFFLAEGMRRKAVWVSFIVNTPRGSIKFCFKLQMLETHGDAFAAVLLVSGDSCSQNPCIPFRLIKTPYKNLSLFSTDYKNPIKQR
jgi:hypothetical protein